MDISDIIGRIPSGKGRRQKLITLHYTICLPVFSTVIGKFFGGDQETIQEMIQEFYDKKMCPKSTEEIEVIIGKGIGYSRNMLRNHILDKLRKRKSHPTIIAGDLEMASIIDSENIGIERIEKKINNITALIKIHIGEKDAHIFHMIAIGMDRKQIAKGMGIKPGAIHTRMSRLRKNPKFRKIVQPYI